MSCRVKIPVTTKISLTKAVIKGDGTFCQYGGVRMKVSGVIDEKGFLNLEIDIEDTVTLKEETLYKLIENAKRSKV